MNICNNLLWSSALHIMCSFVCLSVAALLWWRNIVLILNGNAANSCVLTIELGITAPDVPSKWNIDSAPICKIYNKIGNLIDDLSFNYDGIYLQNW